MSYIPSQWLNALRQHRRMAADLARIAPRALWQTGLLTELRWAGLRALIKGRARVTPSAIYRYLAANQPHRTALIYRDRRCSFYELNERIERTAGALRRAGLRRGDALLLMLRNVPEFIVLQAAAGRLGARAVSVSWRSTAPELGYLLEHSGARLLAFDAGVADVVRQLGPSRRAALGDRICSVGGEVAGFTSYEQLLGDVESGADLADLSDEGAVVIYTSGTTGKPKGAVRQFTWQDVATTLAILNGTQMRVGQVHLAVCPLYHSTAFGFVLFAHTLSSTVVLLDSFEPAAFLDALERYRVDHTAVVPTMLRRVLDEGADALAARDLTNLKAIIVGGAPLTAALASETMAALGDKLYNFYGATETGVVTLATPADLRAAPGTIGRCLDGNEIRLLSPETGREVAPGQVGELYVRSGSLVLGYHDNPEATAEAQRQGFFSVGDLARQDERGYYFLEGRCRDLIISGGVNVYPREVEAALASHPDVREAAVIGVPDAEWGERVRAFVELRAGATCTEDELLAHCRKELAGPKRPREVHILAVLPRNPTGKVLKEQLRELP